MLCLKKRQDRVFQRCWGTVAECLLGVGLGGDHGWSPEQSVLRWHLTTIVGSRGAGWGERAGVLEVTQWREEELMRWQCKKMGCNLSGN